MCGFFCHREKKSKQPVSATKRSCFSHEKIFTLLVHPPPLQRHALLSGRSLTGEIKQNVFCREAPEKFFGEDYPYGYSQHMCYCLELTQKHMS